MPCFKGLAISIHTPDGPLPEYSIQKQGKFSRITSYIPVPPAKVPVASSTNKPEQSTFAISITLLTPGLSVPYSTPRPSIEDPYPRPQVVSGLPSIRPPRHSAIGPYLPTSANPHETIAAYIYFDGRQKEEVATLLRRGEETWVNSRWVSVPQLEGGGLAEREFLFREVGLERWLNGLDLEGKDAAAQIERRRQKIEKKRKKIKKEPVENDGESEMMPHWIRNTRQDKSVLLYGANEHSPLEKLSDEDAMFSSDSDSDDDPIPEATGQIKVALFRVVASGEIKKGEYSPQFDAHDDDEDSGKGNLNGAASGGNAGEADIDHTTSFAQPKSLDPKSISTQTVTGIDGPDKPYAVFTFLYRGEKQLQKMGILRPLKPTEKTTPSTAKRRSVQANLADLKPLKPGGALGFSGIRDTETRSGTLGTLKKKPDGDAMDSDDDDVEETGKCSKIEDAVGEDSRDHMLSPEDLQSQGELSEGVKKIKLKRQHSFESPNVSSPAPATRNPTFHGSNSPKLSSTPLQGYESKSPPTLLTSATYDPSVQGKPSDNLIGSPLKKRRSSLQGIDHELNHSKGTDVFGLGVGNGGSATNGPFGGNLKTAGDDSNVEGSGGRIVEEFSRMEEEL